jgi:cold shock CspA family protein
MDAFLRREAADPVFTSDTVSHPLPSDAGADADLWAEIVAAAASASVGVGKVKGFYFHNNGASNAFVKAAALGGLEGFTIVPGQTVLFRVGSPAPTQLLYRDQTTANCNITLLF